MLEGLRLDVGDDTAGSIIDGNKVARGFPDDTIVPVLDWSLVRVESGI